MESRYENNLLIHENDVDEIVVFEFGLKIIKDDILHLICIKEGKLYIKETMKI